MVLKQQYERAKARFLADESICAENRELLGEFFQYQEHKLKRMNGLAALDDACYKTLYGYTIRLRNVNKWFGNKPWTALTKEDIRRVYDDLEDGRILTRAGQPFQDRQSYYNKIFKSKVFRLAGKAELAKEVIEFSTAQISEARFVTEQTFKDLVSVVSKPQHQLLFWLAWDIGENVDALLKLEKGDIVRRQNRYTNEPEYVVNLPRRKIKRSRVSRSEPTLYPETVRLLDIVLPQVAENEPIFGFGYRQALKLMHSARRKTGATTMPGGEPARWKDLRSGMACNLLRLGWSRDEANARLGHTPNSSALNAYINYLAIDREKPKQKMAAATVDDVRRQLLDAKQQNTLLADRARIQDERSTMMEQEIATTKKQIGHIRDEIASLVTLLHAHAPAMMSTTVQRS